MKSYEDVADNLIAIMRKELLAFQNGILPLHKKVAFIDGRMSDPNFGKQGEAGKDADITPLIEENRKLHEQNKALEQKVSDLSGQFEGMKRYVENAQKEIPELVQKSVSQPVDYGPQIKELATDISDLPSKVVPLVIEQLPKVEDGRNGIDGKDADVEAVVATVVDRVKLLVDTGKSVGEDDLGRVQERLEGLVADRVEAKVEAVTKEVLPAIQDAAVKRAEEAAQEIAKQIPPPENGKDGKDGNSVDLDDVVAKAVPLVAESAEQRVDLFIKSVPLPKDGEHGKDAEPVDVDSIAKAAATKAIEQVEQFAKTHFTAEQKVVELVKQIPTPKDGENGKDGKDAEPVDVEAITSVVTEQAKSIIENLVKEIPKPKDGKDADPIDLDAMSEIIVGKAQTQLDQIVKQLPIPKDGKNGKDINPEFVIQAVSKHVDLYLKSLPPAPAGKDGKSVEPAEVKLMVQDEVKSQVQELPKPEDGRDATQIELLDGIEEDKSYPARTYAMYRGGIIYATRKTSPVDDDVTKSGWAIAVNGTDSVDIEKSGDRSIKVRTTLTKGTRTEEIAFDILVFKGVYDKTARYEKSDCAVYGGSLWAALADTSDRPADGGSWQLVAKRGQNGRDGDRGLRGEKGDSGTPGKDLTQMGPDGKKW